MSFKVNLYTFSKRDNSTKQPTGTGTEFSCVLKSGSGIMRPVLSFDIGVGSDPSQYNYAYISEFGRYYFIEEWFYERALWTATLKVDVLATYKTAIGGSSLYVLRAASVSDGSIVDTLYPCDVNCSFDHDASVSDPWWTDLTYVVGVVSKGGNMGSMAYYGMATADIVTMCQNLLDPTTMITAANHFNLADASEGLQLSLIDPMQYIKSCMALPVPLTDISAIGSLYRVYAFNWDTGVDGYKILQAPYINKSFSFTLKKHPDTNTRGVYVNSDPYTKITLKMPPWGIIDIDTSVTCTATALDLYVRLDPITGKAILTVKCNDILLNRIEAQLGVPISLSSVTRDYVGAASAAVGSVGNFVSAAVGLSPGGVIGSAAGIGNAVSSFMPRANTVGTNGGFAAGIGNIRLDYQFYRPVDDDPVHNGRPLCQMKTISSLSGYVLVQDGDVSTNGTSAEDMKIRSYLESGFYYE